MCYLSFFLKAFISGMKQCHTTQRGLALKIPAQRVKYYVGNSDQFNDLAFNTYEGMRAGHCFNHETTVWSSFDVVLVSALFSTVFKTCSLHHSQTAW